MSIWQMIKLWLRRVNTLSTFQSSQMKELAFLSSPPTSKSNIFYCSLSLYAVVCLHNAFTPLDPPDETEMTTFSLTYDQSLEWERGPWKRKHDLSTSGQKTVIPKHHHPKCLSKEGTCLNTYRSLQEACFRQLSCWSQLGGVEITKSKQETGYGATTML